MPDLGRRATGPELLDLGVPEADALESLSDLRFVNRWLGNRAALRRAVAPHLARPGARLLDVGCGSADVTAYLAREAGPAVRAVGLDLKPLHLRDAPRDVARVVGDVRALPFGPRTFDVVTASLFLHHFDAHELPALLASLFERARGALVVSDLRRARVPYAFGRLAFRALFRSRVSVEDGLLSIRRGFHEEELQEACRAAGLPEPSIRRTWPYRLLMLVERGTP